MSTTTPTAPPALRPPAPKTSFVSRFAWPLGFLALAIIVFAFNQWILPDTNSDFRSSFNDWLPLTAINEAVIWAIFALGLNIVVGYSGLLDLGYVAFWGIGGYVAGWLMAPFANQVNPAWANLKINIFGHPLPARTAGSTSTSGSS